MSWVQNFSAQKASESHVTPISLKWGLLGARRDDFINIFISDLHACALVTCLGSKAQIVEMKQHDIDVSTPANDCQSCQLQGALLELVPYFLFIYSYSIVFLSICINTLFFYLFLSFFPFLGTCYSCGNK